MTTLRTIVLASFLLASFAAGFLAPPAQADPVRLRTGETIKGRPLREQSNDKTLAVEDYLTGSIRRFLWEAIDPEDSTKIKREWGIEGAGQTVVEADRIVMRLADGSTQPLTGIIEREDDRNVYLHTNGKTIEVPKERLLPTRDKVQADLRQIYSPDEIVEREKEAMRKEGIDLSNMKGAYHFRLAQRAEWADALEVARDEYAAAAADPDYLLGQIAQQRLASVEALLQDRAALDILNDARVKLSMNVFRRVREILDNFEKDHPDASDAVKQRLESVRAEFNDRRTRTLTQETQHNFIDAVQDLIRDKVREKGVTCTDIMKWTKKELADEAFDRLASKTLAKYDDVTKDDAKNFWLGRDKRQWRRATYGAGTFIVQPPQVKVPKRSHRASSGRKGGGNRQGGNGQTPAFQLPKPPTRDEWWEQKAKGSERDQWALAYFVEHNPDLFELGERELRPCAVCHGSGLQVMDTQTGDEIYYLCTRCGGARYDITVKFR